MFLYEKKIRYLTLYQDGEKKSSAGFARISRERDACRVDIHIKRNTDVPDGSYVLFLVLKDREMPWGVLTVRNREADFQRDIPVKKDMFRTEGREFKEEEFCGILIQITLNKWISCYWRESAAARPVEDEREREEEPGASGAATEKAGKMPEAAWGAGKMPGATAEAEKKPGEAWGTGKMPTATAEEEKAAGAVWETREGLRHPPSFVKGRDVHAATLPENRWQQLQRSYKKVHPFGDDRMFLAVELKDFHLLKEPYQKLANNSFLLHGFYNYRHLILGPDREMGKGEGLCFYIGVPGTYFEREKMVAVMFGFEGFESSGAVEIGKFGYYMRRVEIR